MIISKKDRLTACVMTSVFALSLLTGGCAQQVTERSEESTGALATTAPCEPDDGDDDHDAPAPMTDDEIKTLEGIIAEEMPAPAPAPPPRPVPSPKAPAPKYEVGTRNAATMTTEKCCALGDSPRRAALNQAVRRRNEDYEALATRLGWGAILAAAGGYAAIQVKNGKPPTQRELAALGITLAAGVAATYYSGVLDIERNYRRAYDDAMRLSNVPTPCDSSEEVSLDAQMAR